MIQLINTRLVNATSIIVSGFTLLLLALTPAYAQTCSPLGNLIIFTNYDGGELNINIDANIPDLKIGICSYEPVRVTISGDYIGNITEVLYAGFNSSQNNNNCGIGNFPTSIIGIPPANYSIVTIPPVTLNNPNGYNFGIICAYSCVSGINQGGCNTIDQIEDYFLTNLGGTLYALQAQYCCWLNGNTYPISALAGSCCVTSLPSATITYNNSPFCTGITTPQSVTLTGSSIGTFSAIPTGLQINPLNGDIMPSGSLPGVYNITYTMPGCPGASTNTTVEISNAPTANISYDANTYCATAVNPQPTITGATGGSFTVFPEGLIINAATGEVDLQNSIPGEYSVLYASPSPCPITDTVFFAVVAAPFSGFSYPANTLCQSSIIAEAVLQPGAQFGIFNATPQGLMFANIATGQIDLANSTPGNYTITNIVAAAGGCPQSLTAVDILIETPPTGSIAIPLPSYCNYLNEIVAVDFSGTLQGTYTANPDGLAIDNLTGSINPANSLPGNYVVSYNIPATAACAAFSTSAEIAIIPTPQLQISASTQSISQGETTTLTAIGNGILTWNTGQTGNSILVSPNVDTTYCVTANLTGCTDTACILITVNSNCHIPVVPNAFTPNGDGLNDKIGITTDCTIQNFEFSIYNRWGKLVFYTTNPNEKWDGLYNNTNCGLGVYVYSLLFQIPGQPRQQLKGNFTLLL